MYYISVRENSGLENKEVKHLKPVTFKELPGISFIMFQEKDSKKWNLTEVETGIQVTSKDNKEELKNIVIQNAERIIQQLEYIKQNPPTGFKKIPLINQEPQPTGAKLCKVLTYTGIKNKFLVEYKPINNIVFYAQVNNLQPYDYIFLETNGYFVNVGSITNCEQIAEKIISENINIHEWIEKAFNQSLNSNQNCFLGYAEYLGRMEEALEHNKKMYDQEQEKLRQREEEKKRREEEQRQKEELELQEAGKRFINGQEISGNMFVSLCDKYDIKLPLRTRGWCLKSLIHISLTSYRYQGNQSTVIYNYTEQLKELISA